MRKIFSVITVILLLGQSAAIWAATPPAGTDIPGFLRTCMWGTAIGAGVGALSLAFQDNPGEHKMNIARGASLGLYGGVIYGAVQENREPSASQSGNSYGFLIPAVKNNQVVGLQWSSDIYQF